MGKSKRITFWVGKSSLEDLHVQRFLQWLHEKKLRQGTWIKSAVVLGFLQVEDEIKAIPDDPPAEQEKGKSRADPKKP